MNAAVTIPAAARARLFGGSSFRVLAASMIGLGVLTGLAFPPFVVVIGVATSTQAEVLHFRIACLLAGVLVGGLNHLLVRVVVGRRLRRLAGSMHQVGDIVREATRTGDWSALQVRRCQVPVDTDDELGEPAVAFNALVVALGQNVAQWRQLEVGLRHQAFHDPLTGLANRALFADRVTHALTRVHRDRGTLVLLCIDLDGFKNINDTLGHAAGDAVLIETARRLLVGRRSTDTVARLGGDEFALLLEDLDLTAAADLAARLGTALRAPQPLGSIQLSIGASIGIALGDVTTQSPEVLIGGADAAMYQAKQAGKDCHRVFGGA